MFVVGKAVSQQSVLHDFFLEIYSTFWLNIWFGDHLVQMIWNAILKIRSFLGKNASFVLFSDQLSLPFKSMHEILKYSEEFFKKQTIKVKSISKQSWNIPKHSSKFTVHRIEIKYLRFCWIESQQLHHICVCARINLKELATHAHIFLTISCCLRQWKCKNYICSFSCDLFHSLFSNNACEYYIWGISFISPSLAYLSTLFERVIK